MSGLALPRIIGHRGALSRAPENTMAGFVEAAQLGVKWVELDVQLTADGVPVVFHDESLERTTNGTGRLVETGYAVVRRLDAGTWFAPQFAGERVPLLEDALTVIAGAGLGLCLEIKADDERGAMTARAGLELALRVWPADRPPPMVSSFSANALAEAKKTAPDWPRGYLVDHLPPDWEKTARGLGCGSVHTRHGELDAARVTEMKLAGFDVLAYVVNERPLADVLWGWGVDAVFSDKPDCLLAGTR